MELQRPRLFVRGGKPDGQRVKRVVAGSQRDLFEAIERGDFPRWKLYVQIMPEADAATVPYHPFDLTKVWPHGDYPLIEVGEWKLNRIQPCRQPLQRDTPGRSTLCVRVSVARQYGEHTLDVVAEFLHVLA